MNAAEFAERLNKLRQHWIEGDAARGELFCLIEDAPLHPASGALEALLALSDKAPQRAFDLAVSAVRRDRGLALAWYALARVYSGLGQHGDVRSALAQALALDRGDAASWQLLGGTLSLLGAIDDALTAFVNTVENAPGALRPKLDLAASFLARGEREHAERVARDAVAQSPGRAEAHFVLAETLTSLGRHADAVGALKTATALRPEWTEACFNLALALAETGDLRAAVDACATTLALAPNLGPALSQMAFLKRQLADWDGLAGLSAQLRDAVQRDASGITPFSFLAEASTPAEQLRCARTWARHFVAPTKAAPAPPAGGAARGAPLRVGLLSSGLNNHPTAILIVELIEQLRDPRITMVGLATTANDGGTLALRLRRAFKEFHELAARNPAQIAAQLAACRLDVLLDVDGYIDGGMTEVLARRPVALQVSWLAYPGTSGAAFIDYLFADAYLIPAAQRAHYSEAIVKLPHGYQPSDSSRVPATPPTRRQCGLPERGTVFACFNQTYKIGPDIFSIWMEILRATPDSVLWLLQGKQEPLTSDNLRRAANAAAIDPQRLIFQSKLPHEQYLGLYRHVDLFLDTWPYNAHTTASDALFVGCPVLTLPGETFASRVAGSLLTTLGAPELIARSREDYVARAVAMGKSAKARANVRQRMAERRKTSALFDTARHARAMERALITIVERQRAGFAPGDIEL